MGGAVLPLPLFHWTPRQGYKNSGKIRVPAADKCSKNLMHNDDGWPQPKQKYCKYMMAMHSTWHHFPHSKESLEPNSLKPCAHAGAHWWYRPPLHHTTPHLEEKKEEWILQFKWCNPVKLDQIRKVHTDSLWAYWKICSTRIVLAFPLVSACANTPSFHGHCSTPHMLFVSVWTIGWLFLHVLGFCLDAASWINCGMLP